METAINIVQTSNLSKAKYNYVIGRQRLILPHDIDEEGSEVVLLDRGEVSQGAESEAVREETVNNMEVGCTHFHKDWGIAGKKRKNRRAQVAIDEYSQATFF